MKNPNYRSAGTAVRVPDLPLSDLQRDNGYWWKWPERRSE